VTRPDVICHGLTGEDAAELVRSAVRVSVKDGFKIIPVGRRCVSGQLALEVGAPLAGRLPAGRLNACDEYAGGKGHDQLLNHSPALPEGRSFGRSGHADPLIHAQS
jgi:hypothetical protein